MIYTVIYYIVIYRVSVNVSFSGSKFFNSSDVEA